MLASVIICTHNPNRLILQRVINSLKEQSLNINDWELLVVDNRSVLPVSEQFDFDWHSRCKVMVEEKLGLTYARIRGIEESKSDLLIFVDDDNILSPDYLEQAIKIGEEYPSLGAWGGSCIGEFEVTPPGWFHVSILGIREVKEDSWSCSTKELHDCPIGAGMVIRRAVAKAYIQGCSSNPVRAMLDRAGNSLMGAGDFDLAFTACDIGMTRGVFKRLKLIHYMPAKRLTREYFIKMKEGLACSLILLFAIRDGKPPYYLPSLKKRILQFIKRMKLPSIQREILKAKDRGRKAAMKILYDQY